MNGIVARAAVAAAPEGTTIDLIDVADVPLYNGDIEEAGVPASVQALSEAIGAADGLLIFSPEYNGSFPAVTKNVIDWMSRPPKLWQGTATSLVVTTPGSNAGGSIRAHWDTIMPYQQLRLFESLGIGDYPSKIADGEITDEATLAEIAAHVAAFAAFCAEDPAE